MDTEVLYNQALDYIYSFIDYSREKTDKLVRANFKLERMAALLDSLDNPQDSYPTIHVAGTKGKGSTCALIASALTAAGYKTGLYTSPHLQEFDERIQVDGHPIPHLELYQLIEEMKPAIQAVPHITTFEVITALAFLFFARQEVGAAVIEVGLGGRLDATNILNPRVSVITSISYDHMAVLGSTLARIAGEKAGIIKPGIPVVSSPQKEEALLVLERIAGERQAPLILVGRDVEFQALEHSIDGQTLRIRVPQSEINNHQSKIKNSDILRIPLLGRHQVENAATAYAALQVSGLPITRKAIQAGFASVRWPCRFELARREPPVIFDSAHNQDSFLRLCQALEDYFPGKPVILVMGASEDKNLAGMLAEIKPRVSRLIAIRADHPRALPPEHIVAAARVQGIPAETADSVQAALGRALALSASSGDILLAAGSMFATAEVKTAWQNLFPEYH
jgi:dihydrofolate synthase / folylpolyglutamate synthase